MKKLLLLFALAAFVSSPAIGQTVSTLASGIGVASDGIFVTPSGDIYVSGGGPTSVVLHVTPDGTVSTFATGVPNPVGIFMDAEGHFIVNNYNMNTVTRITPDGEVSTLATGLNGPAGVVVNSKGEILVSEFGANFSGSATTVRHVHLDGTVEPFATGGGIRGPVGIAVDEDDVVYVANWGTGEIHRTDGTTTTLFADIDGTVNQIAYHGGYLYVPSPSLRKIFRIDRDGTIETIAGTGASGTADGPALEATFRRPNSIAIGPDGRTLYVMDADAQAVRVIHPAPNTSVGESVEPAPFTLHPSYPNPADDAAHIRFTLAEPAHVRLVVSDVLGRTVAIPVDGQLAPGSHETLIDTSRLAAGTYFYRLESMERVARRMMVVAR